MNICSVIKYSEQLNMSHNELSFLSEQLNMSHNELSFLSEKMKLKKKQGKLIRKRKGKEKYTLHVRNFKSKS